MKYWGLMVLNASLWSAIVFAAQVPEAAEKYMVRGDAALDMAKDADGYNKAIIEYEAAAKEAPDWPNPYYNLGMVYSKTDNYPEAIRNFKQYLKLAPHAEDSEAVKKAVYKLEYKQEGINKERINAENARAEEVRHEAEVQAAKESAPILSPGKTGIGLNDLGLSLQVFLFEHGAIEARGQVDFDGPIISYGVRAYAFSPGLLNKKSSNIFPYLGYEFDLIQFKGETSKGAGYLSSVYFGGQMFLNRMISFQYDFGPAWFSIKDNPTGFSINKMEYMMNFGLNLFFN